MCVLPSFYFPVQTPDFYSKYRSLYANVFLIPSKWSDFYSKYPFWVRNRGSHPVWPYGGLLCCTRKVLCAKLG